MASVETVFKRIVYQSGDFVIFGTNDGLSAKGHSLEDPTSLLNIPLLLLGNWESYKGKRSFEFSSYLVQENQIYFFLTKMVKNIPTKTARAIAAQMSEEELEQVMADNPTQLLQFKGIGPKKVTKIKQKWDEFSQVRKLGKVLLPYGVSNNLILRIHDHFEGDAVRIAANDPYRLTEVRGIGFKTADDVALKLGVHPKDPKRVTACVLYCMEEKIAGDGHTVSTLDNLIDKVQDEIREDAIEGLPSARHDIQVLIGDLVSSKKLVVVKGTYPDGACWLALPWYFVYESVISELAALATTSKVTVVPDIEEWLAAYELKTNRVLGAQQRNAVRLANTLPPVMAISGFAGTGKTTTSRAILELLAIKYGPESIVCCSLAGVAANRAKIQSGFPGMTAHSLLEYNGTFQRNAENPLEAQVVLLDEASMMPSELTYRVMSAINFTEGAMLILMGDPAQLPPVGAGAPFTDLLQYQLIPNVVLDKIYRQSEDEAIATFAASVRKGKVPDNYANSGWADFKFVDKSIPNYWKLKNTLPEKELKEVREANNRDIKDVILKAVAKHKDAIKAFYSKGELLDMQSRVQVLSPIKDGDVGVTLLNKDIQEVLNPLESRSQLVAGSRYFREMDKVVHLRNKNMNVIPLLDYTQANGVLDDVVSTVTRVFNGQLGIIVKVVGDGPSVDEVHVCYPNENYVVVYSKADITSYVLDLAYCLSVHKSQGSEFSYVYMPVTLSHFIMLNPKLLYTGMTRAKKGLALIGQKYAFEMACKQKADSTRKTVLSLLQQSEHEFNLLLT